MNPNISISCYFGPFCNVGGRQVFIIDLITELLNHTKNIQIFAFGPCRPEYQHLKTAGAWIRRSPIRRGNRLNIPNHILTLWHLRALLKSDSLLLAKFPPSWFLHLIRLAKKTGFSVPKLVYVTAYDPATLWPNGVSPIFDAVVSVVLVQTEGFREQIRMFGYTGVVHVVPLLPPRVAEFTVPRPSRSGSRIRIGYLGRLVREKNLGYLLSIVARLGVPVEVHIFGTGPEMPKLKRLAATLRLSVIFYGEVDHTDAPQCIECCDVMAITSLYEGQCLVALEALARGRPLIATPVGALPEVLKCTGAGVLIPQANAAAAAPIVEKILKKMNVDGHLSEEHITSIYKAAFDRDAILEIYKSFIGSQSH